MFVVGLCVGAGMVDDAVAMIRRRIERVELQRNTAGIDDVVFGPSRDDDREACFDRRPNAIENPCGQKIKTAGKTRGYPIPA